MTAKKDCRETTYEEAKKIVEEHEAAQGLAPRTDPSSGIVMKPYTPDPSVLVYDPEDTEYDETVRKQAEKNRKADDKA